MGSIMGQLIFLIDRALWIYSIIILARAIISWVQPNPYNPIVQLLYRLTEPVLFPIRRALIKSLGNIGIDFSPFIAFLLLQFIRRVLLP
ncbi:YggT family protein [Candidatus Poribacteria bacterium]